MFVPVGLSLLTRHFQQILLGVDVSSVKLQHPLRPAENVMITMKDLQERTQLLNGTTVKKIIPINFQLVMMLK